MRYATLTLVGIALIAYFAVFGLRGVSLFFPAMMTPFLIVPYFVMRWRSLGSQIVFLVATLAYCAWCVYVYVDVTITHPDPQSPIVFLFVGIYAAPVLFFFWLAAYAFEWRERGKRAAPSNAD